MPRAISLKTCVRAKIRMVAGLRWGSRRAMSLWMVVGRGLNNGHHLDIGMILNIVDSDDQGLHTRKHNQGLKTGESGHATTDIQVPRKRHSRRTDNC